MDEQSYLQLADRAFGRVERACDAFDTSEVDCERAGDVLTLTFPNGKRCIINTQRPTKQIWLASGASAWHFDYAGESDGRWLDDKGRGEEFFATVANIVKREAGILLSF
ncbi:MAG: iron donor protein CyaY [Polyangiaceae bacterium]